MDKHRTTEVQATEGFRYWQLSSILDSKRIISLITAGFLLYICICSFTLTASGQTKAKLTPEQKIAELKKEELQLAETLVKQFPGNINPVMLMGNLWERHGDATKALEYYNKVLQQDPKRADVYKGIGWFYMNTEQYEQAIDYWRKALQIDPKLAGMHQNIAVALMGQNKQRPAIEELEKEIILSPNSSFSYFLLGQLYLQQNEYEKARENYQKAIEIKPNYPNAYYGLFTLSARLKQREKAKEYMAVFKKLKADEMEALKDRNQEIDDLTEMQKGAAETYLLAGKLYQGLGDIQKAEVFFKKATELDPDSILCLERLASLYITRNRLAEAIPLYRKISDIDPKDPICHLNIGVLSMRLKQLGEAEKAFRKVIEIAPKSSGGYRELAQLYLRAGKGYPQAVQLAEKAVTLEPTALNYFVLSWASDVSGDKKNALEAIERAMQLEPTNMKYRNVYEHIKNKK